MEVANASMWDGSTATTEAVLMAERLTSRHRVVVARSLHPEYRQVLDTYTRNLGLHIHEIGFDASGQMDVPRLEAAIDKETAAVVVQSPNFFGVLEQIPHLAELAHAKGALLVVSITEGVSLGAVRPPAEADIVAMEDAELRTGAKLRRAVRRRDRHARPVRAPDAGTARGRDRGQRRAARLRVDSRHARAAHPPREGHVEHMHQSGPVRAGRDHSSVPARQGRLEGNCRAESGQGAFRTRPELESIPGVRRAFSGPFFNEFAVQFPRSVKMVNQELLRKKIIGPLPLGSSYADLTKRALFCVTETTSRAEIERMAAAVREILSKPV